MRNTKKLCEWQCQKEEDEEKGTIRKKFKRIRNKFRFLLNFKFAHT